MSRVVIAAGLVLAGCAGSGRAVAPEETSAEALRVRFHQAVLEFRAQQRPGGAPDAPGLIRLASRMLGANAVAHTFSGRPGDLTLSLQPSLDTGLNRLALQLRETVKGRAIYDLGRLLKDPDAPAHFDPGSGDLFLPHAALLELNPDEPTVRHELVHVRTFGTLRSGWLAPLQGYLKGPGLGDQELFLDELTAYSEDVRFAASQLAEILKRTPEPAGLVARSNLGEILRARIAGQKPEGKLSFPEQVWDRLVARTLFGGSLALTASELLIPVERAGADPSAVTYQSGPDATLALLRHEGVTARFYLPSSTGPGDPKNPAILAKQLITSQQAAQAAADQFSRAKAQFHAVVDELSPAGTVELLMDAALLAGDR
ncbi:MAG: hypothetical protein M3Y59_07410 [Myxococcota bacterium]|nr:hypothetical protein [Myxococcota bacterium]